MKKESGNAGAIVTGIRNLAVLTFLTLNNPNYEQQDPHGEAVSGEWLTTRFINEVETSGKP